MKIIQLIILLLFILKVEYITANKRGDISGLNASQFSKYWQIESESKDYKTHFYNDTLEIISPKGLTLWRKEKMSGDIVIEYDACVMDGERPEDRLSDLNCFWMASDPLYPDDIFKRMKWRNGIFNNCYSLQLYYLGYGGNYNSTTRFRRYDGNEEAITNKELRPAILKEYTDTTHLLKANKWYHIKIENKGNKVSYYIDGVRIIDFRDPNPYTSGWFGFRTTLSRTRIANFKYTNIQKEEETIQLTWIDSIPKHTTPVNFGVPFSKGLINEKTSYQLLLDDGIVLTSDFWPLSYWPDGSVKWGGFSTVVPAHSGNVFLSLNKKTEHRSKGNNLLQVKESDAHLEINTGALSAYIPKKGNKLIDSLIYNGIVIGEGCQLVCITETSNEKHGEELITRHHYQSEVKKVEIERTGKMNALIKIEGVHTNKQREWLPFIVRLYFYAGSKQMKIVHTFIYDGNPEIDNIKGLGLQFDIPMREALYNRHIAFSCSDNGIWSEPVQPLVGRRSLKAGGENIYQQKQMKGGRIPSYEEFEEEDRFLLDNWASWNNYRLSQLNSEAFSIRKQANDNNPWIGTFNDKRSSGVVFVGDVSGGLTACLKDFWQSYPASLEVKNAKSELAGLFIWLWSPESEAMNLNHYDNVAHDLNASYEDVQEGMSTPYGIARTGTIYLHAHDNYPGKEAFSDLAGDLSNNNQLICSPEYLYSQRAFGTWSLPDRSTDFRCWVEDRLDAYIEYYKDAVEQHKWYGFWNYGDFMHAYDPVRHMWKYDIGGFAWDNTELASNMWLWYNFLRTGRADIWKMAEAMTRHTSEVDVYHIGEYAGLGTRHNVSHWGCGAKEARISQAALNRFYYYLTTDERCGDLMTHVKDAEQKLFVLDPMRLAEPRSLYPSTAPARLRIGPDWLAYAGNWMTEWERTGNVIYRDRIIAGMKSIASLPNGLFTGPKTLGFYPDTGIITYEGDPKIQNTNHLMTIMGGFEIMNEMMELIDIPEWKKAWLEHATLYKKKAWEIGGNRFRVSRLQAYSAYHLYNSSLAKEAWNDLIYMRRKPGVVSAFEVNKILAPHVPAPIDENAAISTNDAATWSLDAIYMLEVAPCDE